VHKKYIDASVPIENQHLCAHILDFQCINNDNIAKTALLLYHFLENAGGKARGICMCFEVTKERVSLCISIII
jgi:hypothetical protein